MLIDTHCHLDAPEFDADRTLVIERARGAGVAGIVIPAVARNNFSAVSDLAGGARDLHYALGIHPLYVDRAHASDLLALSEGLTRPDVVAVGEIGLDFFVDTMDPALQEHYFVSQLGLARDTGLPVLLHVRRSQDRILKHLRAVFGRRGPGGIAHAFNGSRQQADEFIKLGFVLGFGGAATWVRALNLRRLLTELPLESIVLETDAPDIPPEFAARERNEPAHLPRIAHILAQVRGISVEQLVSATGANALRVLPRMAAAYNA
ncbi:TatD family hydrolase [Methyloversatilis thermotolerans]|uniref:TatD family hydrolase n=1 Tax=Methyloversatilis thermotolerans TaxID=1346290 RepID=UPI000368F037|nr:TatD family hydrolase [Methyloversatilis thermotolerans]